MTLFWNGFGVMHRSEKCAKRDGRLVQLVRSVQLETLDIRRHRPCKVCMKKDLAELRKSYAQVNANTAQ